MQTDLLIEKGLLLSVCLHLPYLSEFFLLDDIAFFTIFIQTRFLKGREVHHDCFTDHKLRSMETKGHFNSNVLTTCLYDAKLLCHFSPTFSIFVACLCAYFVTKE